MYLGLKNIREHRLRGFELPEKGLVQLRGESGAGKTSLLDSIAFALFDNRRGLKSFERSSCLVELEGLGLSLRRSKGPNGLAVNGFEGVPAQGEIERVLGMDEAEFMASSYIEQDLYGSLLSLPAAEQLRVIQRLACGSQDPEAVRARLREALREQERALEHVEGQRASLAALVRERDAELAELSGVEAEEADPGALRARLADLEAAAARHRKAGATLRARLVDLARQLSDPRYALAARHESAAAALAAAEAAAAKERAAAEAGLAALGPAWPWGDQAWVRRRIALLERAIHAAERADAAEAALKKAPDAHARLAAAEAEVARLETALAEAETRVAALELATRSHDCPECSTSLILEGDRLVRSAHAHADEGELERQRGERSRLAQALADARKNARKLVQAEAESRSLEATARSAREAAQAASLAVLLDAPPSLEGTPSLLQDVPSTSARTSAAVSGSPHAGSSGSSHAGSSGMAAEAARSPCAAHDRRGDAGAAAAQSSPGAISPTPIAPSLLSAELAQTRSYESTQVARDLAAAVLAERLAALDASLATRRAEAARTRAAQAALSSLPPRSSLEQAQASATHDFTTWDAEASRLDASVDRARSDLRAHEERERRRERRQRLAAERQRLDARLSSLAATAADHRRRVAALARLRDLSDRAAADAVGAILATINVNAQKYLEALFPDTGTSVFLLNEKTLASGEKRAKLSLEILHKGARYASLADLSGGERSRVALAFQLALSDVYRSPVLMVDEGMKGLSPDLKLLCLEALREVARDKLVLVVEHGAPESAFDSVVDV